MSTQAFIKFASSSKGQRILLVGWLLINLAQAAITPLLDDEAYYWLWGQRLDWGYFDHPPMVAGLTSLSSILFTGEMGVRLLSPFLSVGCLWFLIKIVETMADNKETAVTVTILAFFSTPILSVYGFFTTPDVPLLFSGAFFLFSIIRFSRNDSWPNALLFALSATLLMYSKYHAALIILFSVVAYLKLLTKPKFWIASIVSIALFIPHILWQYEHGFPSFTYHLVSRSKGFDINNSFAFILSQLAVFGPLLLFFGWKGFSKMWRKPQTRILLVNFAAFPIFFFVSTLKGRAEAHWTALATIAGVALVGIIVSEKSSKTVNVFSRLAVVLIVLLFAARMALISIPDQIMRDFKNDRNWASQIEKRAEDRPVVFVNSYRRASKYMLYTGHLAHSENNYYFRKNQFDIWQHDTLLNGKSVMFVAERQYDRFEPLSLSHSRQFYTGFTPQYKTLQRAEIKNISWDKKQQQVRLKLVNHYTYTLRLEGDRKVKFYIEYIRQDGSDKTSEVASWFGPKVFVPGESSVFLYFPKNPDVEYIRRIFIGHGDLPGIPVSEELKVVQEP